MKKLILVRHAKTEALSDVGSDFERKLKRRGWSDARLIAEVLKEKGYSPDKIIASPAVRAWQTATVFAEVFGIKESAILPARILYDGDTTEGLLDAIADLAGKSTTVVVVGHNPDMAMLSMRLLNERFEKFPTSATVAINFSISNWHDMQVGAGLLEQHIYPKLLK
ncbi:MAG TPA: histidine phosphatase family protein [Marinilabiliaceae bacterium]|nr:histidine phosphatase family protein [Marinilabiliaceae bacterium]